VEGRRPRAQEKRRGLTVNQEALADRRDEVVVSDLADHGGSEWLTFPDEQHAVGAVKAGGEDHAGLEFVEKYFADLFGEVEQVGRLEEEADGFRVEALAGLGEDVLDGLFAGEVAVYVGDGDGEAAGSPRDGEAGDAFWESGAVEAFVVGTDGFADGGAGIDEAGECLAVNGVRVEGLPLAFGEAVGVLAEGAEELARDADEAEVAEPGAGREHAAFLFGEVGGLDHLADDFDKGLGLPAEERIEGREDAGAELEGVFVAFGEALVGRVEGGGLRLQVATRAVLAPLRRSLRRAVSWESWWLWVSSS